MSSKLTALPANTTSNYIIYGVEAGTTDVQIAVNVANGLAALTATGGLTLNTLTGGLVIGTTATTSFGAFTPNSQIDGTGNVSSSLGIGRWVADANPSTLIFLKSRNATIGNKTVLSGNDVIGKLSFIGVNNNGTPALVETAYQQVVVEGSPGSSFVPSRFEWYTGSSIAAPALALQIQNDGNVNIGANGNPANNSRLYIFGGNNGANVDIRGDAAVSDQATVELEGSDYDSNFNSIRLQQYGVANVFGTTLGYANTNLQGLIFQGVDTVTAMIAAMGNFDLHLGTNFKEWAILSKLGDFGVHTTAPTANFQVNQQTYGPGTVSNGAGGTTVTGVGTQFTNTFKIGDTITIGAETKAISAIASDTSMTTASFTTAHSGLAYTLVGGKRFSVYGKGSVVVGTAVAQTINSLYPIFQTLGTTNAGASHLNAQYSNDATGSTLQFVKSRNTTIGSNTAVTYNDVIGKFDFLAVNSNGTPAVVDVAYIQVVVDGNPGTSFVPSRIEMYTGTDISAPILAAMITNSSQLVLGNNPSLTALTISTITPAFQILGTSNDTASQLMTQYSDDTSGPTIQFYKSRGVSILDDESINVGDNVGSVQYYGVNSHSAITYIGGIDLISVTVGNPNIGSSMNFTVGDDTNIPSIQLALTVGVALFGDGTTDFALVLANSAGSVSITSQSSDGTLVLDTGGNGIRANDLLYIPQGAIQQLDGGVAALTASSYSTSAASGASIQFARSHNNTIGVNTVVSSGDMLGQMLFAGVNSSSASAQAAIIRSVADGSPGATFTAGLLELMTGTNAAAPAIRLAITGAGQTILGGTTTSKSYNSITAGLQNLTNSQTAELKGQYSADAVGSVSQFFKSRSATIGTSTALSNNDVIGKFDFVGVGSTNAALDMAYYQVLVDGSPAASFIPSRFEWYTGSTGVAPSISMTLRSNGAASNGGQLIIGNTTASSFVNVASGLQIVGNAAANASMLIGQWTNDAVGPTAYFLKNRGTTTAGSSVAVSNSDVLAKFDFWGINTTPGQAEAAYKQVVVDGNPGASFIPSRFEWYTGTSIAAPTVNMALSNAGVLLLGNLTSAIAGLGGQIQVISPQTSGKSGITIVTQNASTQPSAPLTFATSRASIGQSVSGDILGEIDYAGANNASNYSGGTSIIAYVDGTPAAAVPSRFEFAVCTTTSAALLALAITSGRVVIAGGQNTARASVGITPLTQTFNSTSNPNTRASHLFGQYTADAVGGELHFLKSRNSTIGSLTGLSSGDVIGKIDYIGTNANGTPALAEAAKEQVVVDGAPGTSFVPSRFEWYTGTATAASAIALTLDSTKNLTFGSSGAQLLSGGLSVTNSAPAVNNTIAANYQAIVIRKYSIASGTKLTIGSGGYMRIIL